MARGPGHRRETAGICAPAYGRPDQPSTLLTPGPPRGTRILRRPPDLRSLLHPSAEPLGAPTYPLIGRLHSADLRGSPPEQTSGTDSSRPAPVPDGGPGYRRARRERKRLVLAAGRSRADSRRSVPGRPAHEAAALVHPSSMRPVPGPSRGAGAGRPGRRGDVPILRDGSPDPGHVRGHGAEGREWRLLPAHHAGSDAVDLYMVGDSLWELMRSMEAGNERVEAPGQ
jgi:hypothetical protein